MTNFKVITAIVFQQLFLFSATIVYADSDNLEKAIANLQVASNISITNNTLTECSSSFSIYTKNVMKANNQIVKLFEVPASCCYQLTDIVYDIPAVASYYELHYNGKTIFGFIQNMNEFHLFSGINLKGPGILELTKVQIYDSYVKGLFISGKKVPCQ